MKKLFVDHCNCQNTIESCKHIQISGNDCKITNETCTNAVVSFASIFRFAENAADPECKDNDIRYKDALKMWAVCTKGKLNKSCSCSKLFKYDYNRKII